MTKKNYILTKNFEGLGEYYLQKGLKLFKKKKYNLANEYFKNTLVFKTRFNYKTDSFSSSDTIYFEDLQGSESDEQIFSLAFVSLFCTHGKEHRSLEYINSYLKINDDFHGNLIKTIVLYFLSDKYNFEISLNETKKFQQEHIFFSYAASNAKNRLGEDYIKINHQSFVENYTDYNSLKDLYEMYKKKDNYNYLNITPEKLNNLLINCFYYKNLKAEELIIFYTNIVNMQVNKDGLLNYPIINIIKDFIKVIEQNESFFIELENSTQSFYHTRIMEEENRINDLCDESERLSFENENKNNYYNENLDLDQQDPDFWNNI
jgi:hypothetical protein